jgi:hypothetical protein
MAVLAAPRLLMFHPGVCPRRAQRARTKNKGLRPCAYIHLRYFSYVLQESTLRQECSKYGTVQHVKMLSGKGGKDSLHGGNIHIRCLNLPI